MLADGGAYPKWAPFLPILTQMMSQAVYDIPKIHFDAQAVSRTPPRRPPSAARAGPRRPRWSSGSSTSPPTCSGMDPAELRRSNHVQPEEFPYTTATGAIYDSGDYEGARRGPRRAGYADLRAEQAGGGGRRPQAARHRRLHLRRGHRPARPVQGVRPLTIDDDGGATVHVGTSAHGQGHDTAFSMIVYDRLGIPMDKVRLVQSDTARSHGRGHDGLRSLQTAGSASPRRSEVVLDKAKRSPPTCSRRPSRRHRRRRRRPAVAGVPAKALSWADLRRRPTTRPAPADGDEAGLAHELDFAEGDSSFPFGAHVAVVEIDPETGGVTLLRHVAVDDCGRIVNPLLVAGQQHGGIAQGIAQALFERVQYDDDGNPLSGTLWTTSMPSAAELPSFEASTPDATPRNPLGAKGIGESGTIGSTPAVHSAVMDALSHLGIRHLDMPCTPEKVWRAIEGARSTAAA